MKYLGKGRMRAAFKIGNKVIKVPINLKGVRACFEERQLWRKHRSSSMAPILASIPGLCVVMPYYGKIWTGATPEWFRKELNTFGIIDLHEYNVRKSNGKPIAIDYAINLTSHGQGEPTGGW